MDLQSAVTNVRHKLVFETCYTDYSCTIGPMPDRSTNNIRTPSFPINSIYLVRCYIVIKWDDGISKGFQIRLVCETNTDINKNQAKIKNIIIKDDTKVIYTTKDKENLYLIQDTSGDYFYWYNCPCTHNVYEKEITITCRISQVYTIVQKSTIYGSKSINPTIDDLYDRLNKMFKNKQLADVKIKVGDKTFRAHKSILVLNPVFEAMLEHDMSERRENIIHIKDMDPDVFETLLIFLYLGEFNIVSNMDYTHFLKVIAAADMYQIQDMKEKLSEKAMKYMDVSNVLDFLITGDRYNVTKMKEESLNFIAANVGDIRENKAFQKMLQTNASLAMELLCFIMNKPETLMRV